VNDGYQTSGYSNGVQPASGYQASGYGGQHSMTGTSNGAQPTSGYGGSYEAQSGDSSGFGISNQNPSQANFGVPQPNAVYQSNVLAEEGVEDLGFGNSSAIKPKPSGPPISQESNVPAAQEVKSVSKDSCMFFSNLFR
jgi:hypothetical protein